MAAWIDYRAQRSPRLLAASAAVAHFGNPGAVALAGLTSAALLSARHRSLAPGFVVVTTIGAAVFAKDVMKVVIERSASQPEMALAPALTGEPHPFPSGHVAGTAALLGIVAFAIGARAGSALRVLLAGCVIAGTGIVAVSRLVLDAHWLTDVVGGALLAGIVVTLGATVLGGVTRARRPRMPAPRGVVQARRLRA